MKKLVVILALAILAPLLLAAAGCGGEGENEEADEARPTFVAKGAEGATGGVVVGEAVAAEPASAPSAAPVELTAQEDFAVAQSASSLPAIGPRVVQTAFLRVVVPRGRFDETVTRARNIARSHGGFVTSSTATKGLGERLVRGTIVLRVPEGSYVAVMEQVERLGKVEAREESGQDVSAQFVDLQARARHLEAVESQLLEFLDRTDDVGEALAIQAQLNQVQLELEQVRGQLRYLEDQTSFATISLDLRESGVVGATGKKDDGWGVVDAWRDGARGFVRVVGALFVGVATAAPILLLIAAALVAGRFALASRRRRTANGRPVEHAS